MYIFHKNIVLNSISILTSLFADSYTQALAIEKQKKNFTSSSEDNNYQKTVSSSGRKRKIKVNNDFVQLIDDDSSEDNNYIPPPPKIKILEDITIENGFASDDTLSATSVDLMPPPPPPLAENSSIFGEGVMGCTDINYNTGNK